MIKKIALLVGLMIFSLTYSFAQKFLVLEKMGTRKRIEIFPGEELRYQLKSTGKYLYEDRIRDLKDSTIIFNLDTVKVTEISKVYYKKQRGGLSAALAPNLIGAGILLFVGDQFNEVVIAGNEFSINNGVVIASSSLVGTGVAILLLQKNKYTLTKNWRLRTVNLPRQ